MIIIGTSLSIKPFNKTVEKAKKGCPKVLINLEHTDFNGFDFQDLEKNPGRLFLKGKCDDIICQLVKDVGWSNEFYNLNQKLMDKTGYFSKEEIRQPRQSSIPRSTARGSSGTRTSSASKGRARENSSSRLS